MIISYYAFDKDHDKIEMKLNKYLEYWFKLNRMVLNLKKSEYIFFVSIQTSDGILEYNGIILKNTQEKGQLTVLIDSYLNVNSHTKSAKITAQKLNALSRTSGLLHVYQIILIFNSFIEGRFN